MKKLKKNNKINPYSCKYCILNLFAIVTHIYILFVSTIVCVSTFGAEQIVPKFLFFSQKRKFVYRICRLHCSYPDNLLVECPGSGHYHQTWDHYVLLRSRESSFLVALFLSRLICSFLCFVFFQASTIYITLESASCFCLVLICRSVPVEWDRQKKILWEISTSSGLFLGSRWHWRNIK